MLNRFLKKEWEDSSLSASDHLEARNKAWSRFRTTSRKKRRYGWVAALPLAAAMVAVLVVWWRPETKSVFEPRPAPFPSVSRSQTATLSDRPTGPPDGNLSAKRHPAAGNRPKGRFVAKRRAPESDNQILQTPRLVLNMELPTSGVRLIWVQDANFFRNEGDLQ